MPLTPADVHNVAFSKPPIGKRGYNEDEVDAFLDLVENELTRLIEENADLRQRVAELDQELACARCRGRVSSHPGHPAVPSRSRNRSRYAGTGSRQRLPPPPQSPPLGSNEEHASRPPGCWPGPGHRGPADRHRQGRIGQAARRRPRQRRLDSARPGASAETTVTEARPRADAMLADAQTRSETQLRQAQEKADALQADAERKHSEIMGTINQQRTVLEGPAGATAHIRA